MPSRTARSGDYRRCTNLHVTIFIGRPSFSRQAIAGLWCTVRLGVASRSRDRLRGGLVALFGLMHWRLRAFDNVMTVSPDDLHGLRPRAPRVLKLPMRSLGRLTLEAHYDCMMRVCWLSMLIACLAAMAAIGPPALARTAAGPLAQVGSVVAAARLPSHHRHDCGQAPCALMVGYTATCPASAPLLSAPAIDLPSAAAEHRYWPLGLAELAGQRPLPNPLPPKP